MMLANANKFEIDEIRAVRRRISERHDHDLGKLFQRYQDLEQQLQVVSSNKRSKPAQERAATGKH